MCGIPFTANNQTISTYAVLGESYQERPTRMYLISRPLKRNLVLDADGIRGAGGLSTWAAREHMHVSMSNAYLCVWAPTIRNVKLQYIYLYM